jgi:hypothetical protein
MTNGTRNLTHSTHHTQTAALGANLTEGDVELFGRGAIHLAAYHGRTEAVKLLLDLGTHTRYRGISLIRPPPHL